MWSLLTCSCALSATWSTCSRASRASCLTYPRVLRALCRACSHASSALCPAICWALRAPVPHVPCAIRALRLDVLRALHALVSYALLYLTYPVPCVFSCCSYLVSYALFCSSSLTCSWYFKPTIFICISCLVAFMSYDSYTFGAWAIWCFATWTKVNHCNRPFLKKERHYNGFISLQDLLTSLY